jgi:hypothetical protein
VRFRTVLIALAVLVVLAPRQALGSEGARAAGEGRAIPGQFIVVLTDDADPAAVAAEHARLYGAVILHRYEHALRGYAARLSPAARRAIEADPRVRFIEEDAAVSGRRD